MSLAVELHVTYFGNDFRYCLLGQIGNKNSDARAAQLTSVIDSMDSKAGSSAPTSGNSLSGETASLPPAHTYHVIHMDFAQHWTF